MGIVVIGIMLGIFGIVTGLSLRFFKSLLAVVVLGGLIALFPMGILVIEFPIGLLIGGLASLFSRSA